MVHVSESYVWMMLEFMCGDLLDVCKVLDKMLLELKSRIDHMVVKNDGKGDIDNRQEDITVNDDPTTVGVWLDMKCKSMEFVYDDTFGI